MLLLYIHISSDVQDFYSMRSTISLVSSPMFFSMRTVRPFGSLQKWKGFGSQALDLRNSEHECWELLNREKQTARRMRWRSEACSKDRLKSLLSWRRGQESHTHLQAAIHSSHVPLNCPAEVPLSPGSDRWRPKHWHGLKHLIFWSLRVL